MTKYVGITIGPIDRIAEYSKSTRSIWASSYIFSFLAKNIISHLKNECKIQNDDFITPIITDDMFEESPVGRFSDQYVINVAENTAENIIKEIYIATDNVLTVIAGDIATTLKIKTNIDTVKEYLKRVIKVYATIKESTESTKDDSAIVSDFQATFAAMECFDTYQQIESRNYLAEYFQTKAELLANDANNLDEENKRKFRTILEISGGLKIIEANLVNKGQSDSNLKTYQKYIAFVAADGDNFGKTIARDRKISKIFTEFNTNLREAVSNYGGQTIFQGGDDIMFFAPMYSSDDNKKITTEKKSNEDGKDSTEKITDIFALIKYIDDLFEQNVINPLKETVDQESNKNIWDTLEAKPSLSYGVAIAYYKHPMNETRQRANDLLHQCKDEESYNRNAIAWEVRKHSGQTFHDVIDKKIKEENTQGNVQFDKMLTIISNAIKRGNDVDDNFLHSITHWIISHKDIIESVILKNQDSEVKKKLLANYFKNNFNEEPHNHKQTFINSIREFLLIDNLKEPCSKLHALLRYVELLINKSDHGK